MKSFYSREYTWRALGALLFSGWLMSCVTADPNAMTLDARAQNPAGQEVWKNKISVAGVKGHGIGIVKPAGFQVALTQTLKNFDYLAESGSPYRLQVILKDVQDVHYGANISGLMQARFVVTEVNQNKAIFDQTFGSMCSNQGSKRSYSRQQVLEECGRDLIRLFLQRLHVDGSKALAVSPAGTGHSQE